MKNRDLFSVSELDCPYRQSILTDDMSCSQSFGCSKGFDPDQESGSLICDIVCWLDEEADENDIADAEIMRYMQEEDERTVIK